MQEIRPTLHLPCGKIAPEKSTLAKNLPQNLVRDDRLEHLFPGEIDILDDYVRCTRAFVVSDVQFDRITSYSVAPEAGFNIIRH